MPLKELEHKNVLCAARLNRAMTPPTCLTHTTYTYKGETAIMAAVTGDFCPACAESVPNAAQSDVMREIRVFSKQANAAIANPEFITSVRK